MQGQAVSQGRVVGQAPELAHASTGSQSPPPAMDYVIHLKGQLPNKDTYCLGEEVTVAGHLIHFVLFWEEVIQADHWVWVVICHGYSIELFHPPPNQRGSGMPNLHLLDHMHLKKWKVYYMEQVQTYGPPTGHFNGSWQQ